MPSKVKGISLNNLYDKVFESINALEEKSKIRLFDDCDWDNKSL